MALADLSDRDAVLAALREYDELGRDAFLAKYGFRRARRYFLIHDGKRYDSKAIAGVAHGHQFPDQGPLGVWDFGGGDQTVRPKLEELGFTLEILPRGQQAESAWDRLITQLAAFRKNPNFDAEERDYKLDVAQRLADAMRADATDRSVWLADLRTAFGGQNNLTNWRNHSALLELLVGPQSDELVAAIKSCLDQDLSADAAFTTFAEACGDALRPGAILELGSVLLFAAEPDTLPPMRRSVFDHAIRLTDGESVDGLPVTEQYQRYLEFAEECWERLEAADVPVRDMLDVQSLLWILYNRPESGGAVISGPRVWVEKTHVKGRPDRSEGEFALGKAMTSPAASENGSDVYRFMRQVERGDVILHLTDGEGFTGVSHVSAPYEDFGGIATTSWGLQPSYLVRLEDFTPLDPPLLRQTFFDATFGPRLVSLLDDHRNLFYNRQPALRQGAHLTPLPAPVVSVLNDAYESIAGHPLVALTGGDVEDNEPVTTSPPTTPPPTAGALSDWLRSDGLIYSPRSIAIYLTALQTKGFVILSGVSGTGKTKLAQSVSELMSDRADDQHVFVTVRPDWRDSRGLIGYFNPLSESYESTRLLRLLLRSRGLDDQGLVGRLRERLAAEREWLSELERTLSHFEGRTEFSDEDLTLLWHAQNNGIANAGLGPRVTDVDPELLKQITQGLADAARSPGERLVDALTEFRAANVKRLPVLRTLRALAAFEPTRVSTAVDSRKLWETARDFFGYRGPGLRHITRPENEDPDAIDELFETVEAGVLNLLGPDASRAERTAAPWLLNQLGTAVTTTGEAPESPYFVILDEMNLARVEYYFAEFLSVLESGRDESGRTREALALHDRGQERVTDTSGGAIPDRLQLAPNLYFVGTINVDETTHALSPKVLDRAFTLQIDKVTFGAGLGGNAPRPDSEALRQAFTRSGAFAQISRERVAVLAADHPEWAGWLQALSDSLRPYDLHFAYRTFDEIMMFTANAIDAPWFDGFDSDPLRAFDVACLTKVLPKFSGVRAQLREPLMAVLAWAIAPDHPDAEMVQQSLNSGEALPPAALPAVARKAERMLRRLGLSGFASYA